MKSLQINELQKVHGGLSSSELATVAALTGKTFVESVVIPYVNGATPSWTNVFAVTGATYAGVYGGFQVFHWITD